MYSGRTCNKLLLNILYIYYSIYDVIGDVKMIIIILMFECNKLYICREILCEIEVSQSMNSLICA